MSLVVVAELLSELGPFLSGKGTLKFRLNAPVPFDLVRRVVRSLGDQPG